MKTLKILSLVFALMFSLWSCEEVIDYDPAQTEPVVVVQGLLTTHPNRQYVKLTYTNGFYSTDRNPVVSNAQVRVEDNLGNVYPYQYWEEAKMYFPTAPFQGEPGRFYTLYVDVNGQLITASDTLRPVTALDKLEWAINKDEQEDKDSEGYFYEVWMTAVEPKDSKDFYQFKYYRNDTVMGFMDGEPGLFVSDDIAIAEEVEFSSPIYYHEGDTAIFEMYSLTSKSYRFYLELSALLNNDGGMFSGIPANPYSNVRGEDAVGYFQVSDLQLDTLIIGDPNRERPE